jgi:hypothetical protein
MFSGIYQKFNNNSAWDRLISKDGELDSCWVSNFRWKHIVGGKKVKTESP